MASEDHPGLSPDGPLDTVAVDFCNAVATEGGAAVNWLRKHAKSLEKVMQLQQYKGLLAKKIE